MDELLEQFLIEGRELVQQAGDDLLALERTPADRALLDGAFRSIHTLKGSVGLFDLAPMGLVLHAAEDLLGAIRNDRRPVDRHSIDVLLAAVGQTERWIDVIGASGTLAADAPTVAGHLAVRLRQMLGDDTAALPEPSTADGHGWVDALLSDEMAGRDADAQPRFAVRYVPDAGAYFRGDDPVVLARTVPGLVTLNFSLLEAAAATDDYNPFACNLAVELTSSASLDELKTALRLVANQIEIVPLKVDDANAPPAVDQPAETSARTLRIDARRIDALAEIAEELVIVKNALADLVLQAGKGQGASVPAALLWERQASLERLTGRLHQTVMGARKVPLMPVLGRFPRMVREMAMALGKDVDLRVAGSGIDVDKSIADALVDPLTHLIRNALDHGIERPDVRRLAGKPSRAAIELTISREGDQLLMALRDDGRGIDAATIRRVALDRGLLDEAALAALDDEAAVNLVFQPGFSTAERVTDISGRGVGMDAVRATISGLGGRVSLSSSPGHGTTVHLTLPMNSVLTGIVLISCAGERYGVPLEAIVEAARVPVDQIFPVRSGRAFILRDRTLPLIDLHELLGAAPQNGERDEARVLIVRVGSERVALGVDAILDRRELSLRPMPRLLSGMRGISGTALLGDGEMVLVLDPEELIG